ncbi:MAG TPA: (Fe-S)-binding protein [bacterium]|nr:(Fe-S)-binding protein [bacterium]
MTRASLFITCLVDHLFPSVAGATTRVLERLGVRVLVPAGQTCCGQLPFNDGFWDEARRVAAHHLRTFADVDAIVTPSGSCAGMVRHFYPVLFEGDPASLALAAAVGDRTYELSEFLTKRLGVDDVGATFHGRVTYLASCHGYRELGLYEQPLRLLRAVRGLEYVPLPGVDECCGFGGAFAVKMAPVSGAMLRSKIDAIRGTGASVVTGTDASCLMHVGGGLSRGGAGVRALHLAEILAGEAVSG